MNYPPPSPRKIIQSKQIKTLKTHKRKQKKPKQTNQQKSQKMKRMHHKIESILTEIRNSKRVALIITAYQKKYRKVN